MTYFDGYEIGNTGCYIVNLCEFIFTVDNYLTRI